MNAQEFFRVIRKRIVLLILVPLITVLIALIFVRMKDATYVAHATLATGITEYNIAQDVGYIDNSPGAISMRFANLIELMRSKMIMDFVSYDLMLHDLTAEVPFRGFTGATNRRLLEGKETEIINLLRQKLDNLDHVDKTVEPGLTIRKLLLNIEYDYESLTEMVTIFRLENSDYIRIRVETEDPDLSAFIANSLIKHFLRWYEINRANRFNVSIGFLGNQVEARRDVLDRLIAEKEQYTVDNTIANLNEQTKELAVQIAELELRRSMELRGLRAYRRLADSLDTKLAGGAPQYREAAVAGLNNDLAESRQHLARYNRMQVRARTIYDMETAAMYQDSIDVERERVSYLINSINERAFIDPTVPRADLVTRKLQIMFDIELAEQAILTFNEEIRRLEGVTREFARRRGRLEALERDIIVAQEEYITLLNKLNDSRLASSALQVGAMMDIIARAFAAEDPLPNKRWLIVVIAGLAAFVFTLLAIFLIEYYDRRAQTPLDIANLTGQPVISGIPVFDDNIFDLPRLFTSSSLTVKEQAALDLIRQLRLYLMKHMPGKRLLVTSTQTGAGKSFLTLFLGFSLARAGKRVLLVDMSRNQTLTRQLDARPTLQQYLAGKVVASEAITKTDSKFIDVLGCDADIRTPLEITTSDNIEEKFQYFEQYYDYILIDTTSLIRYNHAREIVHHADASLLVMDAETLIESADQNAVKFLTRLDDVKFMGIVMNKVQLENLSDFYGNVETRRKAPKKQKPRKQVEAPRDSKADA